MTRLKKIRLSNNAEVLSEQEMKAIKGGSFCAYSTTYDGVATCVINGNAMGAEFMAGTYGWWCCGCAEAIYACTGQM